jgi:predicted RNase H-like nuclease (RuvC/YqgF family)
MDPSDIAESISAGVENAMSSVSLGVRAAGGEACAASARAQQVLETGRDHLESTLSSLDSALILTLKQGILYGMDHQVISTASVTAVALLSVPGLRRMAWRATFGRLSSQENLLKTSESSVSSMLSDLHVQKNEIEKLGERLTMAQKEYARGRAKLVAAAKEMRTLESRAGKSERRAKDLLYEIRGIRAKGALQLRSDAAVVVEAAKTQRRQVEKICWKLDSHMI